MDRSSPHRCDETAPAKARRFVGDSARGYTGLARIDDVLLLTSELVTNAIEYGAAPASLDIYCDETALSIEVHDAGNNQVEVERLEHSTTESVRGLAIVAALADEWGVTRRPSGKTVWFRFRAKDRDTSPTSPARVERVARDAAA